MTSQKLGVVKMEMERLSTRIAEFEMCHGPRESGAVKRSSMDLTNALANLRRSGR